jgi:hypothetical protein
MIDSYSAARLEVYSGLIVVTNEALGRYSNQSLGRCTPTTVAQVQYDRERARTAQEYVVIFSDDHGGKREGSRPLSRMNIVAPQRYRLLERCASLHQ